MSKEHYIAALEGLMADGLTYKQASDRAKEEGRWPPKKEGR
jgi:hypothetical protein